MNDLLVNIWNDDNGQDIAEYALMLVLILVLIMATVTSIGQNANTIFDNVATCIKSAAGGKGC